MSTIMSTPQNAPTTEILPKKIQKTAITKWDDLDYDNNNRYYFYGLKTQNLLGVGIPAGSTGSSAAGDESSSHYLIKKGTFTGSSFDIYITPNRIGDTRYILYNTGPCKDEYCNGVNLEYAYALPTRISSFVSSSNTKMGGRKSRKYRKKCRRTRRCKSRHSRK